MLSIRYNLGIHNPGSTCVLVRLHCKVYVWKVRLFDTCPCAIECISQPNVGHSEEHTDKECSGTIWVVGSLLVGLPCISEDLIWGFGPQLEHFKVILGYYLSNHLDRELMLFQDFILHAQYLYEDISASLVTSKVDRSWMVPLSCSPWNTTLICLYILADPLMWM